LDVKTDPVPAQGIALLVADVRILQGTVVMGVRIVFQDLFTVKVIHKAL
jgi:hypothetical protein